MGNDKEVIIFATKDAGPAEYLAGIIKPLRRNCVIIASPVSSKVFDRYNIKNSVIDCKSQYQCDQFAAEFFKNRKIGLIITGTSWGNCIDKSLIRYGIENHIRVISVIEHWSNYRERFLINNSLVFPNYILVNDKIAKKEAIKNGLPRQKIYSLGNPVLEKESKSFTVKPNKKKWLENLRIRDSKVVTFISEEYSQDFPESSNCSCGFNEYQVVRDILQVIDETRQLIIKLHPGEKLKKYDRFKCNKLTVISNTDIGPLIKYSDFIIGMGSMLLLRAAIHRDDILSYRPNDKKGFIGNRIGATHLIKNKKELHDILLQEKKIKNAGLQDQFNGSTQRIVKFIKDKLE